MLSLVRDLERDTTDINRVLKNVTSNITNADTFINLFRNGDYKNTSGLMYYYGWALRFRSVWRENDGTIQQLNYAGGLRVIENKIVIDSIQRYISTVRDFTQILTLEDLYISEYRIMLGKIFSGFVYDEIMKNGNVQISYNPDLISHDRKDINEMIVKAIILKTNWETQVRLMNDLLGSATSLIKMIKQKYIIK